MAVLDFSVFTAEVFAAVAFSSATVVAGEWYSAGAASRTLREAATAGFGESGCGFFATWSFGAFGGFTATAFTATLRAARTG